MQPKYYDHQAIEKQWQAYWEKEKTYKAEIDPSKPKYYALDMFPYPSGSGLHVGHPVGYTATDIMSRYKRQQGYNVLHPMGWDSFGLPAEQYAIRTGTHPAISTDANITNIRSQLKALGFSYDWDRELKTSDPKYYKWTQWIFNKLYEKELAYQADMYVNFCPELGTVLANEEVENGVSKEGGFPIERRALRQWVLKITAYADRLIEDLEDLDWPDSLKKLQINWIGKSIGAKVHFIEEKTREVIPVYTTRHDTIFGVTFLVLAPEHPLVKQITTSEMKTEVEAYVRQTASKSEVERQEETKDKTGVWTGAFVVHPVTKQPIPVWISDYVLLGYGTGAVMGVPGNCHRDFDFAQKFNIPILPVIDPDLSSSDEWKKMEGSETEIKEQFISGKSSWEGLGTLINSQNEELNLNGLSVEDAKNKVLTYLVQKNLGEKSINYKLRDWLFSRQRYWGEPFPVLHLEDGSIRNLDLDELPLLPPEVSDYKPSKTGESPLAKVKEWVEIYDKKSGKKAYRETNIMPQWAGSCWYYLRFLDPHNDSMAWSQEAEKYWMPVDLYIGGAEHAVLHLLYARFWHKVLYDCGLVSTKEPFQALRNQGLITAYSYKNSRGLYVSPDQVIESNGSYQDSKTGESLTRQVDKMSKSKLNGVSPDEIIEEFGADALRLYVMFMGPLDKEKIWNTDAVSGCRRFLNRFFDICMSEKVSNEESEEANLLTHRLVDGVAKDIEMLQFNTAIAKMMTWVNDFMKLSSYPKSSLKMAIQCLYSFAPHLAYHLWDHLGFQENLSYHLFPKANEVYLQDKVTTYVVQVNGKLRGRFDLPLDESKETITELAKQHPNVSKFLEGEVVKVIFVPNKLVNFVVKG